jgi:hypothetical protein
VCRTHGKIGDAYNALMGNMKERDHLGDIRVDGRIILEWIFSRQDIRVWSGYI